MLYVLFQNVVTEEEAEKLTGRKMVTHTDAEFYFRTEGLDLNNDDFFKMCIEEIDRCDVPFRNVVRDLITGETHSFDRVSSGVKALWLMNYKNKELILPSAYFGPNCYRILVESSKTRDIYIYDDAAMMSNEEADNECIGCFTDYHTGTIVEFGDDRAWDYTMDMEY